MDIHADVTLLVISSFLRTRHFNFILITPWMGESTFQILLSFADNEILKHNHKKYPEQLANKTLHQKHNIIYHMTRLQENISLM